MLLVVSRSKPRMPPRSIVDRPECTRLSKPTQVWAPTSRTGIHPASSRKLPFCGILRTSLISYGRTRHSLAFRFTTGRAGMLCRHKMSHMTAHSLFPQSEWRVFCLPAADGVDLSPRNVTAKREPITTCSIGQGRYTCSSLPAASRVRQKGSRGFWPLPADLDFAMLCWASPWCFPSSRCGIVDVSLSVTEPEVAG